VVNAPAGMPCRNAWQGNQRRWHCTEDTITRQAIQTSSMHTAESSEVSQAVEDWTRLCDQREASGNYLGACDAALLGLEHHPEARELQYRAVLNLSRIGANKRARQLWLQYRIQPNLEDSSPRGGLEENIAALGARLDREEAYVGDSAQRAVKLKRAAQHYEAVYKRSTGTFPGINAAVLHELSGNSARASELAAHVAEAQTAMEDAAALAGNAMAIASTRKQLIQIINYKGLDQAIVSLLRNRNVIHYTGHMITPEGLPGRFPAQAEAQVADRIRLELANHNVGYGYGSLACGADTLIVEALLDRGGEVSAVLPFEPDSFLRESVACGGAKWPKRFDKCLKQVEVIHATDGEHVGDPEVFAYASRLAMGLAIVRAQQLCSEVVQLAVWDGQESNETAGTFADIQVWRNHNLKTVTISSGGDLPAGAPGAEQRQQALRLLPARKVRAVFGDFRGFSRLSDKQILTFYDHVTDRVASVIDKYASEIVARNTWGDGAEKLNIKPPRGTLVAGVDDNAPAKAGGIQPGDVLVNLTVKTLRARYTIRVESLEGICWNFTEIVSARGIKIRIPVQLFDAPFRVEESPETPSLIKLIRNVSGLSSRVPQPYSQQRDDGKHIRSSRRAPFARAQALRFVHSPVQSGLASRRIEYSS
jgi:tetratricopeptide repeat protein